MKKKITKIIAITMSVIIAASCFAGCGSKNKNKGETENFTKIDYLNFMEFPIPTRIYGDKSVMDVDDIMFEKKYKLDEDTRKAFIQEFKRPSAYKLSDFYGNININASCGEIKEGKCENINYCVDGKTFGEWLETANKSILESDYIAYAYASEFKCLDDEINIIEDEYGKTIIANVEYCCYERFPYLVDIMDKDDLEHYYKGKVYARQDRNRIYIIVIGNKIGNKKNSEKIELSNEEKNNKYKERILSEEEIMTVFNNVKIDDDRVSSLFDISSEKKTYGSVNGATFMESKYKIQKYEGIFSEKFICAGGYIDVWECMPEEMCYDFSRKKIIRLDHLYDDDAKEKDVKIKNIGKKWVKITGKYDYCKEIYTKVLYIYDFSTDSQVILEIKQPYTRDGQKISEKLQTEIEKNLDSCKFIDARK